MFDGRIHRAAFALLLPVLVVAGFSLGGRPAPLGSTLAPDAFDGARAFAGLQMLAHNFPNRAPGSTGDEELASYVAQTLREASGGVAGGFQVSVREARGQTLAGERTLTTVVAERPGSTGLTPIVIVAHRDASTRGATAELSATAALLELARVFSQTETYRTIVLVSSSGGSGGYVGAANFLSSYGKPLDAAIVLGDLAGKDAHRPFVLPFSSGAAFAPEALQRTLEEAISQEVGAEAGELSLEAQLAHLVLPLASGEQALFNGAGVPAVLVQVSGERQPSPSEPVNETRLQSFGRAVLSATYALDEGPDISRASSARLRLGTRVLPAWAVRLLVFALLFAPLLVAVDALARARRRRHPLARWIGWTLVCALPFLACALFALLLGQLHVVAAPAAQLGPRSLAADSSANVALVTCACVLLLALLGLPSLLRRLSLPLRPTAEGAPVAVELVLVALALLVWAVNPFAALLLVAPAQLFPLVGGLYRRPGRRVAALCAVAVAVLPLLAIALVYAHELSLGLGAFAQSVALAFVGGQIGPFAAVLWCIGLGCALAVVLLAPEPVAADMPGAEGWEREIATRGPASYAGPGSLGGTESALRH